MNSDLFNCSGQVAVVTGAWGMLGQQFCVALAEHGAQVAALDIAKSSDKVLPAFEKYLREKTIQTFQADITQRSQVEKALSDIKKTFGSTPTVLINNAGIDSPPNAPAAENGPFETYPEASLEKITRVNLFAPVICCQVFGGEMARTTGGSIINIASIYGVVSPQQDIYEYKRANGAEWFKPVAYSISKSGILNLTRYLATYWAKKNVRVNTLTPAGIENSQDQNFLNEYLKRMPMGRMAKKDELNGAIIFLASKASSYMTGANLVIDGGWTAW